ncbi:MAG TPA: phosphoribosyltransferase family protein [Roseiflexaceae bacterium]|nr:phosphoribosyltransferase family protein [Roseiflexaceae bacterium]
MGERTSLEIFEDVGAILTNTHVVYTSGRHGSTYVNKDALYPHTSETAELCGRIAAHFADLQPEVVAGPTIGGVLLAQWIAHQSPPLPDGRRALAVFAEEHDGARVFRRGYADLIPGKRVLVVEDILTTGGSARKVVDAVRALGGEVIGLGALCNRGGVQAADLGAPELFALLTLELESWDAAACPLCRQGIPLNTRVGKAGLATKVDPRP